ncbi:MAG: hypothetical protein AB7P04_03690, partial [Bacteriovoracia bacterium]
TSRWDDSAALAECSLLRLVILRDLYRYLHAERSKVLVEGSKKSVDDIRALQTSLEELRGQDLRGLSLSDVISRAKAGKPLDTPRRPAAELLQKIEREKLERYDRKWESALAAEAFHCGWGFWHLDAWVKVSTAEAFHGHLSRSLWPKGIVLFVEASPGNSLDKTDEPIWKGRWVCTLSPQKDPKATPLLSIPGISSRPDEPRWNLL